MLTTSQDPYYVYLTVEDKHGKKKTIQKRRFPPEALSKNDKKIYLKVLRRQHHLDNLIDLGIFKFGYSALIGLIPVVGDFTDYAFAVMLIRLCKQIDGGIPRNLEAKMQAHAVTALLIGFIPVAGDIADAVYKVNKRNAKYLADYLDKRALAIQAEHEGGATATASTTATGAATGQIASPTKAANGQSEPAPPPLPNRSSRYRPTAGPGHALDGSEIIIAPDIDTKQETGVAAAAPIRPGTLKTQPTDGMASRSGTGMSGGVTNGTGNGVATPKRSRFSSAFSIDRKAVQPAKAAL